MLANIVSYFLLAVIAAFVIILLASIPYNIGYHAGYKDGQVGALGGDIHYKLERQSNNEFIWVECPGICRYDKEDK